MPCVLQDWVCDLTFMQQSVLITACRGPDGLPKDHVAKVILRWLRRCFLRSALQGGAVLMDPWSPGGGSFTGPMPPEFAKFNAHGSWPVYDLELAHAAYLRTVDGVPHHFHLHLMHAAEILGYKHPVKEIREGWLTLYRRIVNDAHLFPETEAQMDTRLGDNEGSWRAREEVTAL